MAKGLSKGMIDMYVDMLKKEFRPLLDILEARTHDVRPIVEKQVKRDLGVYDLMAKEAALKVQLKEIQNQLEHLTKSMWHNNDNSYYAVIDREVSRRMEDLNEPATKVKGIIAGLEKKIMLSIAPEMVVDLFAKVEEEVAALTEEFKDLRPLTEELGLSASDVDGLRQLEMDQ